jgi:hypothetical protein
MRSEGGGVRVFMATSLECLLRVIAGEGAETDETAGAGYGRGLASFFLDIYYFPTRS